MTDQLQRQININLQLRRQLEACRRDVVEYCAKFCEENEVGINMNNYVISPTQKDRTYTHPGDGYAKGLRESIGSREEKK